MMNTEHGWMETADADFSLPPIATVDSSLDTYCKEHALSEEGMSSMKDISVHPNWLEHAAPVYNISSNIKDYVTVPIILLATDLPNRNLTAFPARELAQFSPPIGDLVYKGWKGKPLYIDHKNLVYDKAIGVCVDASMRKLSTVDGTDLYKVVSLVAMDTSKGHIPDQILSGQRKHYSMGALVRGYSCSICEGSGTMQPTMRSKYECLPCGRQHASRDRNGKMQIFSDESGLETKLGYMNAHGITPFEISSVPTPAFSSATPTLDQFKRF